VVSGKITAAEDGSSIRGVNVVLYGTANGTVTDVDGAYRLYVPSAGGRLVFSFIGLQTQEVAIGERSVIDVMLGLDVQQLTEVVVTAQGIERNVKALGYAQTTIASSLLADKPETDIGRALQGRTPGVQILQSSGIAGSGSRVNIRGNSSITGNTQPLWVVDGVPINTDQNDTNQDFRDGQVAPTRFLDLDPNNVESISVLRGLSATTLYGSQGRNGVILVTTKTGGSKDKSQFAASLTQSYFVNEAFVPEYQNKWGNGFDGAYGEFFSNWGSLFDGKPTGSRHPYWEHRNTFPEFPEFQIAAESATNPRANTYAPVAAPNNVSSFFKKGKSATTSLSLNSTGEFGSIGFSYSHLDESGFIENNTLVRDNFSFGGKAKLTNKLTLYASYNFARTDQETPPSGAGFGSNVGGIPSVFANLFYTPRNIAQDVWPFENPVDFSNVYYRNGNDINNPRWVSKNTRQTNLTNRFFSSTALKYELTDWLSVNYRLGYDTYSEKQSYWNNRGGGSGFATALTPGAYRTTQGTSTVIDHSFLVNVNKELSSDISLIGVVGANWRDNQYSQIGLESLGQVVYGLQEHRNFTFTNPRDWRGYNLNFQRNSTIAGVFVDAGFEYKNMLYLNLSGRNDWSTNLQKEQRSLFYPGASIAFLPTAAFPSFASNILDFLKLRVAYGTSANFGSPYSTVPALGLNAATRVDGIGNVVTSRLPSLLANPNLAAERLVETEFGIEAQLLENRVGVNLSYYNKVSNDQIIQRPLDPSTGYQNTFINAGKMSNKGIELSLTGTPIKSNTVTWDITVNFTKNVTKVESLPEGSKEILINGFSNRGNFAIEGEPLNVIKATYTEKAPDGQSIINSTGSYQQAAEIAIIGDPNPDWLGSVITGVTWKSFNFGMQWDYVSGGQVFSYTAAVPIARGVSKDLESFDPTLPLILPGVLEQKDGSGNVTGYVTNNLPLTTAAVFFGNTIIGGSPDDKGIYEASRVRFREISLGYSLPQSIVSKMKLKGINISLIGNNLWFKAINAPQYAYADFDRTAYGSNNGAGFDYLGGPSAKRYGATIKVKF
jgi:TonB-linked SusC/RagA family outer membrane protein